MPENPDLDKIRDKIRKIERLAAGTSPEEADAARRMAERLRKEYGVFGSLEEQAVEIRKDDGVRMTSSRNRDIYVKRYVLRDRSVEEAEELKDILNQVTDRASREFNLDCEIRWNTSTEEEKFLFFFTRKYVTMWVSILAPTKLMLDRMCVMFLSMAEKKSSGD